MKRSRGLTVTQQLHREVARRNPEIMADYLADELGARVRELAWKLVHHTIRGELEQRRGVVAQLKEYSRAQAAAIVKEVTESLKPAFGIPRSARGLRIR